MSCKGPALSILTLCYNEAPYLPETIGSIRAQFFRDYEVVVIDNGSTDDSFDRLRPVIKFDCRFRVIRLPHNQPFPVALNLAARLAKAEWMLVHNADDVMLPGYLGAIARVIAAHPTVTCIFSPWRWIGNGDVRYFPPYDPTTMVHQHQIPGIRAFRRDLWDRTGGEDEAIHVGSDWDWAVRASQTGIFHPYQLAEPFLRLRIRPPGRTTLSEQADFPRLFAHMAKHRPGAWASWDTPSEAA